MLRVLRQAGQAGQLPLQPWTWRALAAVPPEVEAAMSKVRSGAGALSDSNCSLD